MAKKFEASKFDNDRGVKEGSPRDRERDRREMKRMREAERKGKNSSPAKVRGK